jgi:ribosomal protein L17
MKDLERAKTKAELFKHRDIKSKIVEKIQEPKSMIERRIQESKKNVVNNRRFLFKQGS